MAKWRCCARWGSERETRPGGQPCGQRKNRDSPLPVGGLDLPQGRKPIAPADSGEHRKAVRRLGNQTGGGGRRASLFAGETTDGAGAGRSLAVLCGVGR